MRSRSSSPASRPSSTGRWGTTLSPGSMTIGHVDVVEADEGDVAVQAEVVEGLDGADRDGVLRAEQGGRPRFDAISEQRAHGRRGRARGRGRAHAQSGRGADPAVAHRVDVAAVALAGREDRRHVAEVGDVAMAVVDEVSHGVARTAAVIGADEVDPGQRRRPRGRAAPPACRGRPPRRCSVWSSPAGTTTRPSTRPPISRLRIASPRSRVPSELPATTT